MGLTFQMELTDGQLEELKREIIADLKKSEPNFGKRTKPYTVSEFAKATNKSARSVRREIQAGMWDLAQEGRPYLIKASEFERFAQ